MNTQEVANRLVQLCREGKNVEAINELYHDHIVSHEPKGTPMEKTEGKPVLLKEYLSGGISPRKLAVKHGLGLSTVRRWLMRHSKYTSPNTFLLPAVRFVPAGR